jgi:uncharacterized phage-associated protein
MKLRQSETSRLVGFKSRKAAQICAYFALSAGKSIEKLKLIKLVYLSERDFISQSGLPMLYDEFFSLMHGPICSNTLNGINEEIDRDTWSQYTSLHGNDVRSVKNFKRKDYDEISDAELDVLNAIWTRFGWMTASQIRKYTHKNCPEYTEVEEGRIPISYRELYEALGEANAEELEKEISYYRRAENILRT